MDTPGPRAGNGRRYSSVASTVAALTVASVAVVLAATSSRPAASPSTILLNPAVTYQTMVGWEADAWIGQGHPHVSLWEDEVARLAVDDLGISRLRVEVVCGLENDKDYYALRGNQTEAQFNCYANSTVNDNGDPNTINWDGFHFSKLDETIEHVVLPMKQHLETWGESLFINICYVAFSSAITGTNCPPGLHYDHRQPGEYAEFVLAVSQHLRDKYGLLADSWEFLLEPDNGTGWSGQQMGQAIVEAGARLRANGFATTFVAPSTTSMGNAPGYFDQIVAVPGALPYVKELSYHRYTGVSAANLEAIVSRAQRYGLRTAMLEHVGSGYEDLHTDLKTGMNSSWEQYAMAGPAPGDPGGRYYLIRDADTSAPKVVMASRTKALRQYFKFIRPGAVRIGTASNDPAFDALGFINAAGDYVVVVKADHAGSFSVQGLPAGSYAIKYTTDTEYDKDRAGVTIASGQSLDADIPDHGVITIYRPVEHSRRVIRTVPMGTPIPRPTRASDLPREPVP